jgi:hypothetical protein
MALTDAAPAASLARRDYSERLVTPGTPKVPFSIVSCGTCDGVGNGIAGAAGLIVGCSSGSRGDPFLVRHRFPRFA